MLGFYSQGLWLKMVNKNTEAVAEHRLTERFLPQSSFYGFWLHHHEGEGHLTRKIPWLKGKQQTVEWQTSSFITTCSWRDYATLSQDPPLTMRPLIAGSFAVTDQAPLTIKVSPSFNHYTGNPVSSKQPSERMPFYPIRSNIGR